MLDKDLTGAEWALKHNVKHPEEKRKPSCPQCDSKDVGTEVSDEWYCYDCGHQWNKKRDTAR